MIAHEASDAELSRRRGSTGTSGMIIVWVSATTTTGVFKLAYRRYDASEGAWSQPTLIENTSIANADMEQGRARFAFGGNPDGLAAIAFADKSTDWAANLRLASFY